ncbi:MAG: phytanoyl-CoA dioxygenase family protein [Planctomycetota bacterium]|nr:phytanoyl-CoA dioxygenase family protein [Planctomycetota bacterium]
MSMNHALSHEELERFHRDGYLGPYALCAPAEMLTLCERMERGVLTRPGTWGRNVEQMRHLDAEEVRELVAHPAIVGRLQGLFGPDLLCWRSNFFYKAPGGKEVPWHQDAEFWQLDPPVNVTAWLALDEVTAESACVQLIPGSHKKILPHVKAGEEMLFDKMAELSQVPVEQAVDMVLRPGEFFIFNERILHHSEANRSARTRKNMVIRYSLPFVHIPPLYEGHQLLMVSGEDRFGLNATVRLPEPAHA